MTSIFELFERINTPVCLEKINWRMELRGFEVNRIASIIIGIEDDIVCEQVARIIEVEDFPEYFNAPRCADYEKDDERILPYYMELFKRAGLHNAKTVREALDISMKLRQKVKEKEKAKRNLCQAARRRHEELSGLAVAGAGNESVPTASPANRQKDSALSRAETKHRDAIKRLLDTTDEKGAPIFREQAQWYAVFKVLSVHYDYPSSMTQFCRIMTEWGMDKAVPKCNYESIKKVQQGVKLPPRPDLWYHKLRIADDKTKQQIIVAKRLIELLEE